MNPLAANLIRTYVPAVVGAVVAWLISRGVNIDPATATATITAITGVLTAGYYTVVRLLEERFPALGALLLLSKPATLTGAPTTAAAPEPEDDTSWYKSLHEPAPVPQPVTAPSFAQRVAPTGPQPTQLRKADTGAIPTYRTPPGR